MIKKIIQLIKYLRYDITKSFLASQSAIESIIKDKFFAFFCSKESKFKIINMENEDNNFQNKIESIIKIFEKKIINSNTDRAIGFSKSIFLDEHPDIILNIIKKHHNEITRYLGKNFLTTKTLVFRNINFDQRFSGFDVYSNIWHQDSHEGNRILKIFILLHDVGENDGPFYWLNEDQTKINWEKLRDRWSFEGFKEVKKINGENKLTGKKGSYLILDTSRCMHRASIPEKYRDMMQVTLYPKWLKRKSRFEHKI